MKRCFEHRELLTLLLAAPARIPHITTGEPQNNHIRRLAAHLKDGTVANFPAHQLKSILSALVEECQGSSADDNREDDPQQRISIIDQPPHKKTKRSSLNNNLHSILRLVERIINQRYEKKVPCQNKDDEFLADELKSYFGTKDIVFQTEEDILCLAFEMAHNSIMGIVQVRENDDQQSGIDSIHGSILCDGVVKTALRIIDLIALINRRERASRGQLNQAKKKITQLSSNRNVTDRRKKYEHLLSSKKKQNVNAGNQEIHSDTSSEVKSIVEERYPHKWEWLHQFRARYESKSETSVELKPVQENEADIQPSAKEELQQSHYANHPRGQTDERSAMNKKKPIDGETEKGPENNFVIVRRRIETVDDLSLPSSDSDEDIMNDELGALDEKNSGHGPSDENQLLTKSDIRDATENTTSLSQPESALAPTTITEPTSSAAKTISPYDKLDKETHELRLTLLDMPASESSSPDVVRHTVDEIINLLSRYGELDGAAGISRCGDIFGGDHTIDSSKAKAEQSTEITTSNMPYPLNDAMVSSLVKAYLTDATGALRAKAFLRSFVLPLMVEMNPAAKAIISNVEDQKVAKNHAKPASRLLTSLLATLARDRPTECVLSVVVPSLVLKKYIPWISSTSETLFEPTRFQCELISRALKGKDALSNPAITLLVEQVLPIKQESSADTSTRGSMKWTEHTMPLLTACLNRQPTLSDDVVANLADEISYHLSPKSPQSMVKSMKFSSLFHALVTKYGSQVKSAGKVESLKDTASRLKTFMSKTIALSLKKVS